ncbi:hypothetical protein [Reichenbachiella sp. MSK19-1]|uniref:hypothetical protein n=1 Tax=Reichenbachiella sp. MSK19-1 TaxID=1897631 RepID=UPI000E6C0F90|nr:hypothetical protein [Reichenbachiella sp. MSK19-1]RJE72440.1 hypothetical protein BGP76_00170 [Reichenbachiella sp. MSK19-1]
MENIQEWLGVLLGIVIVLAPLIIFVITIWVIKKYLSDQDVHYTDLLAETEVEIKKLIIAQEAKKQEAKKNEDTNQETKESEPDKPVTTKRSASRLVLFLSGITSLILGVCITSFYFYMNIYRSIRLDLSDFTYVLLALGIGVVPYSVNQIKKIRL